MNKKKELVKKPTPQTTTPTVSSTFKSQDNFTPVVSSVETRTKATVAAAATATNESSPTPKNKVYKRPCAYHYLLIYWRMTHIHTHTHLLLAHKIYL